MVNGKGLPITQDVISRPLLFSVDSDNAALRDTSSEQHLQKTNDLSNKSAKIRPNFI